MLKSLVLAGASLMVGAIPGSVRVYAQGMNPQAPSETMSVDERRLIEIRGFISALRDGLELRPEQRDLWQGFETSILQTNSETRTFAQTFCTLSNIRDQASNPAVAAHRATAIGELMSERGRSLDRLSKATAGLYTTLTPSQARRYSVLSPQLFRLLITPAYSSPQTGFPAICADTAQGGFGRPPIIMPGPNMIRPVPRPQESAPKAIPL